MARAGFFVLLLGYAAGRFRVVDNHQVDGLNALVMDFALPASLFAATAPASRHEMLEQGPLFLVFGLTMLLLYVGWYAVIRACTDVTRSDASLRRSRSAFRIFPAWVCRSCLRSWEQVERCRSPSHSASGSILISPLTLIIVEMSAAKARGASEKVDSRF